MRSITADRSGGFARGCHVTEACSLTGTAIAVRGPRSGSAVTPILTRTALHVTVRFFAVVLAGGLLAQSARAQAAPTDERAVIAVADSVLMALSSGDNAALVRLTLDSAVVGGIGLRNGAERMSLSSWHPYTTRTGPSAFTERGFDATARVQDRVAQVWVPYDLYIGDKWSHCGVDTFTMMKADGHWRVASLIYTIEQPPACRAHPAGPPSK